MALGMTIPSDQLAGYCCPSPSLTFKWALGTERDNLLQRVVVISEVRCVTCGTDYAFDGVYAHTSEDKRSVVLRVATDTPLVVM